MTDQKKDGNVFGWILPAAILFWIIVIILILAFCVVPKVNAQEPPPDVTCLSEWHLQWIFYNHKYCDGGTYELYTCRIQKKDYQTIQFKSTCYNPHLKIDPPIVYLTFLPIVVDQTCPPGGIWSCFEGYCGCTIIGIPPMP